MDRFRWLNAALSGVDWSRIDAVLERHSEVRRRRLAATAEMIVLS